MSVVRGSDRLARVMPCCESCVSSAIVVVRFSVAIDMPLLCCRMRALAIWRIKARREDRSAGFDESVHTELPDTIDVPISELDSHSDK